MKRFSFIVCLLLSLTAFAQKTAVQYSTTYDGEWYTCSTNQLLSENGNYSTGLTLMATETGNTCILFVSISAFGDPVVVSVARLDKGKDVKNPYETTARVAFDNGKSVNLQALVYDKTSDKYARSTTVGATLLTLYFSSDEIPALCQKNIQSIQIQGHSIDIRKTDIKTAAIIDRLFQEIVQKVNSQ